MCGSQDNLRVHSPSTEFLGIVLKSSGMMVATYPLSHLADPKLRISFQEISSWMELIKQMEDRMKRISVMSKAGKG